MRRGVVLILLTALSCVVIVTLSFRAAPVLRAQNLLSIHGYFDGSLKGEKSGLSEFIQTLRESQTPATELNLAAMYAGNGQFQLLHPRFALKSFNGQRPIISCLPSGAEGGSTQEKPQQCDFNDELPRAWEPDSITRKKQLALAQILRRAQPPDDDFILTPPFLDSSGNSFAYLLSLKDVAPFNTPSWVREHLSFFRPSELKATLNRFKIEAPNFETIAALSEIEIRALVEGSPILVSANVLLVKNELSLGFSPLSYYVYDIRDVRSRLQSLDYDLVVAAPGAFCLDKIGNACWTYSSKTAMAFLNRYAVAIVVIVLSVLLILIALYFKYVIERNHERERQRTSLQVLSHEFRTPVTALLLLNEELNRNLHGLAEKDQDLAMRISAETFRLQRIIEMSKTYLQSTSDEKRFRFVEISSINAWIEEFAEQFDARIRCEFLQTDNSIKADPFWLRFALENMVQNAFAHGKQPVFIRLSEVRGRIHVTVEDQGICEFDSLGQMTEAFAKSPGSSGMGLGLNITNTIVREWGGKLKFSQAPTSFEFAFEAVRKGPEV